MSKRKFKKGTKVRVVAYEEVDPNYNILINKTGVVTGASFMFASVMLDDMPTEHDHVWLFETEELEPVA